MDDQVYERFRRLASDERSGKKGFLGDAITETMSRYVEENGQETAKKRLLERIRKGYNLGVWKKGFNRDALHERH